MHQCKYAILCKLICIDIHKICTNMQKYAVAQRHVSCTFTCPKYAKICKNLQDMWAWKSYAKYAKISCTPHFADVPARLSSTDAGNHAYRYIQVEKVLLFIARDGWLSWYRAAPPGHRDDLNAARRLGCQWKRRTQRPLLSAQFGSSHARLLILSWKARAATATPGPLWGRFMGYYRFCAVPESHKLHWVKLKNSDSVYGPATWQLPGPALDREVVLLFYTLRLILWLESRAEIINVWYRIDSAIVTPLQRNA